MRDTEIENPEGTEQFLVGMIDYYFGTNEL